MTVGNYIAAVRTKISDDVPTYRVPDTEVAASLRVALLRARQVRPSIGYANGVIVPQAQEVDFTGVTSATVRSELDPYFEALVLIAAARVLVNDNADTLNVALSEKWRGQGMELLLI